MKLYLKQPKKKRVKKQAVQRSVKKKPDPKRHINGALKCIKKQAIDLARVAFILGRESVKLEVKDRIGNL